MAEGYGDENGLIRRGERHDLEERAVPPVREDDGDDEGDDDGDDEPEGDED